MRKSPIRHNVHPTHSRYHVSQYPRGHGKGPVVTSQKLSSHYYLTEEQRMKKLQQLQVSVKSRRKWAEYMWYWSHKGRVDFNIRARTHAPATSPYDFMRWSQNVNQPTSDLIDMKGLDRPRKDVLKFKNSAGNNVYVGSGSDKRRRDLGLTTRRILHTQFTMEENRAMHSVFMEASSPGQNTLGQCSSYPNYKGNFIMIRETALQDDLVVTHELLHAMRHGLGIYTRDRNREEVETDLETMCRVPKSAVLKNLRGGGYYQFVPWIKKGHYRKEGLNYNQAVRKLMLADRRIIFGHGDVLGSDERSMKGKAMRRRINERGHLTHINKAHFSPAELLDRYFFVKDEGITTRIHVRYDKPPTVASIKKGFIKTYGSDVQVWEFQDGKKVKFL